MFGLLLLCAVGYAQVNPTLAPPPQGGNQIIIDSTDVFHFASFGPDSIRIRKLLGNVVLRQDSTVLFCDSAYQYLDSNYIEAFGKVRIVMNYYQPDSMRRTITSRRLTFDGDTKIIDFWDDVVLTDRQVVLKTPRLTYYRTPDYAEYLLGGELTNKDNVLVSQRGFYYPKHDMAYFKQNVKVTNPDFTLVTDTLGYNTESKVAFFMAPTWVNDSVNTMYTEDGFYDTERDFVFLHQNASIGDTTYTLYADTIEYDQGRDLGKSMGHVRLEQADSSLSVFGKYAEFRTKIEATFVTDSAFAVQRLEDGDTLLLFADTLSSYKDTLEDKRYFMAYHNASFLTDDMQGVCDSLVYWYDDSLLFFFQSPVLWSEQSQITGDTIKLMMRDGTIDSMSIPTSPFIASREDTVGYNQIKGKRLHAKFREQKLSQMWIFGNSESIYYTKDDQEAYMGMNKARCSDMHIEFKDNRPSRILFREKPEGEFYPIHMVLFKENLLEGFTWREKERPVHPQWVEPVIYRAAMLRDPLRQRMNQLLLELEEVEFDIWNLLKDSIYAPAPDTTQPIRIPEEGDNLPVGTDTLSLDTLAMDTLAIDTVPLPDKGLGGKGKGNVKASDNPALVKLTQEQRRTMNHKQQRVYNRKRREAIRQLQKLNAEEKPDLTFKQRWVAFKKKLKEKTTEEGIEARKRAKLEHRKKQLSRKAKRMERRHQRAVSKKNREQVEMVQPKDGEFNNVDIRKRKR